MFRDCGSGGVAAASGASGPAIVIIYLLLQALEKSSLVWCGVVPQGIEGIHWRGANLMFPLAPASLNTILQAAETMDKQEDEIWVASISRLSWLSYACPN